MRLTSHLKQRSNIALARAEHAYVHCFQAMKSMPISGNTRQQVAVAYLLHALTLGDKLSADFDTRLQHVLVQIGRVESEKVSHLLALLGAVRLGLLLARPLLELHLAEPHDRRRDLVAVVLFFLREAQNVKGFLFSRRIVVGIVIKSLFRVIYW